jgi:hypothetical protein
MARQKKFLFPIPVMAVKIEHQLLGVEELVEKAEVRRAAAADPEGSVVLLRTDYRTVAVPKSLVAPLLPWLGHHRKYVESYLKDKTIRGRSGHWTGESCG